MSKASALTHIIVKGAREHNLQSVDLELPKNQLICFSGVSGSGKSSLAFDTLYAEGQRRYVESLSSYARQFLGVMQKPDVDQIDGLAPAISIDQKTTSSNPRSTVGTITEVYDYLRLLFARVGHPACPNCGREVSSQTVDQIAAQVWQEIVADPRPITRLQILAPIVRDKKGSFQSLFERLLQQGYSKVRVDKQYFRLDEEINLIKTNRHQISVIQQQFSISKKEINDPKLEKDLLSQLRRALEEALQLADGLVIASFVEDDAFDFPAQPQQLRDLLFSERLACSECNISLKDLEPRLFSFNAPQGACPTCNGLGSILKIDTEKIIAPSLTLSEGAIIPFARTLSGDTWWARLVKTVVDETGFDYRRTRFEDFDEATRQLLLFGSDKVYTVEGENRFGRKTSIEETFEGFVNNLERRYQETESEFIRREIGQFMQKQVCQSCSGARLNQDALAVTIHQLNIAELTHQPINQALAWHRQLINPNTPLKMQEQQIAASILKELIIRLEFLDAVGVGYLTLDREAGTLAGGEAQRIRLASQIGTGLSGVLYILDEPTIGLHQRDNQRLIETLHRLRDRGNTVIVVEHDREVMRAADWLVDFGPGAGKNGGQVVVSAPVAAALEHKTSLTAQYLRHQKKITRKQSAKERQLVSDDQVGNANREQIRIFGARQHNLKAIDVEIPLGQLVCITGVSGSGKSTLLHDTIYPHLQKQLGRVSEIEPGPIDRMMMPDLVKRTNLIDQKPIGRTPRSNPATYSKAFDIIRQIFANTQEAKIRGYKPGRFSFNTKGGRCEACQGDGQIKIEMQFLADVYVTCEVCQGKRYNQETLQVEYKSKTISDVLDLTIDEAANLFTTNSKLSKILQTLLDVGLGYMQLGQPAPTLSGGEAQRLKLARELAHQTLQHNVYLLDEPTTGLHFADIQKLMNVLDQLVKHNNTVVVIEHNLELIQHADWIIDLGPEGGEGGGEVVAMGTPAQVMAATESLTGKYLQDCVK